jgi:hypothetical protein
MANRKFWSGRRVTVTGHTGFKGTWLATWLAELGADVTGIALPLSTEPSLFGAGLTDADLGDEFRFHLAHDRLGTMLGVHPPSQFGRMALHEDGSASFAEKPSRTSEIVNGGYFFFHHP